MTRRSRALLPVALTVPLLIAACGSESTDLPAGLGPLVYISDMALPSDCDAGNASGNLFTVGPARTVLGNPSYTERKGLGCLPFSTSQVWAALQLPSGMDVAFYPEQFDSECEAWPLPVTDPKIPVTFVTKEIPFGSAIVRANWFEITWRVGISQGDAAAPGEVNVLYGKTAGTTQVPKILGSIVFKPLPNGWTRIEVVRQLNTNGWSDDPGKLQSWVQLYYEGMRTRLTTGQPLTGAWICGKL